MMKGASPNGRLRQLWGRPDRLDIAVKYRFFRHLMRRDDPDAARLYRWHIWRAMNNSRRPANWTTWLYPGGPRHRQDPLGR